MFIHFRTHRDPRAWTAARTSVRNIPTRVLNFALCAVLMFGLQGCGGFDGDDLFVRPGTEIVTLDPAQVRQAEGQIESCEYCHPDDAEIPFDWILGEVTGREGRVDFLLTETAHCPNCRQVVTEKTLVEPT